MLATGSQLDAWRPIRGEMAASDSESPNIQGRQKQLHRGRDHVSICPSAAGGHGQPSSFYRGNAVPLRRMTPQDGGTARALEPAEPCGLVPRSQEDFMHPSRPLPVTLLALFCSAAGCASERPEAKDPSFETLRERELESERQEFIQERRQEISEVSKEMGDLKGKLSQPSESVEEPKRAAWSNSLFELEQERDRLSAELERAEGATEEEWKQMRGDLPMAVDSLQAGVSKLGNDISNLFTSDERKVSSDSGLCAVAVSGVDTEIESDGEGVLVEITTSQKQAVGDLQQRAEDLGQLKNYRPASLEPSPVQTGSAENAPASASRGGGTAQEVSKPAEPIPLRKVAVQNIDDGVRITFLVASDQREKFRDQVSEDANRLTAGECRPAGSQRRVSSK